MNATIITFLSCILGLLAVFTKTRHEEGKKSVTFWGWLVAALLLAAGVAQYSKDRKSDKESDAMKGELISANASLQSQSGMLTNTQNQLSKTQVDLAEANVNLKTALKQIDQMWDDMVERLGIPYDEFLITIKTGTDSAKGQDAGTDATVEVLLIGENGKRDHWQRIDRPGDSFEEGRKEGFRVRTVPLGKLQQIGIRRSRGDADDKGWRIESLLVENKKKAGVSYKGQIPKGALRFHVDPKKGGLSHTIDLEAQ